MKTLKMNLANIQGKMNRREMKLIMAGGSGYDNCNNYCDTDSSCGGGQCPHCSAIPNWAGKKVCIH